MAQHTFGIMEIAPKSNDRYDDYNPEKYETVSVWEDDFEKYAIEMKNLECFSHSIDLPRQGLEYCGITLIPPTSLQHMIDILMYDIEFADLGQPQRFP